MSTQLDWASLPWKQDIHSLHEMAPTIWTSERLRIIWQAMSSWMDLTQIWTRWQTFWALQDSDHPSMVMLLPRKTQSMSMRTDKFLFRWKRSTWITDTDIKLYCQLDSHLDEELLTDETWQRHMPGHKTHLSHTSITLCTSAQLQLLSHRTSRPRIVRLQSEWVTLPRLRVSTSASMSIRTWLAPKARLVWPAMPSKALRGQDWALDLA